jgi:hypothetical protein
MEKQVLQKAGFDKNAGCRHALCLYLFVAAVFLGIGGGAWADEEASQSLDRSLQGIKFGVLAYIDYSEGRAPLPGGDEENYSRFSLTRGYFTLKKSMTDWMGMRMTMDVKQESDAAGTKLEASYVTRLKYLYAELKPEDLGPFTDLKAEVGLGHMPWLDFEEHINPFRCQGTMAVERAHVFNSADMGLSLRGYLGGRLDRAEQKTGSHYYDGRYGSWHLGVYNGGGYHAVEENQNKVIEGRVTLRPLPDLAPGLQISYFGLYGEGNRAEGDQVNGITLDDVPGYTVNLGMLSFQHPAVTVTGQYFTTQGNQGGEWIQPDGEAIDTEGWSAFLNLKVPGTGSRMRAFGRYDFFDTDPGNEWAEDTAYTMTIAGLAFDLHENNLLLFAWESADYERDADLKGKPPAAGNELGHEDKVQAVWQIKF